MINKYEIKKFIIENGDKLGLSYNKDEDAIYLNGNYLSSLDSFIEFYRRETGQSFSSIYYEHATLNSIIKCDVCGTVIFTTEDEYYDKGLRCPTCTDYKTYFKYWTKEDIESDDNKQKIIEMYEEFNRKDEERYLRERLRGGKKDNEIFVNNINIKNYKIEINLECDDITKSYFRGLQISIYIWKNRTLRKHVIIPLSWSSFYIHCIYKHLGICHPDLRSNFYIGKAIEKRNKK